MSFGLTFTIIFGVVFSVALFLGFLYEKELKEFENILVRYISLKIKARKMDMSVEEYVNYKKSKKQSQQKAYANVVSFDDWVA